MYACSDLRTLKYRSAKALPELCVFEDTQDSRIWDERVFFYVGFSAAQFSLNWFILDGAGIFAYSCFWILVRGGNANKANIDISSINNNEKILLP